MSNQTIGPIGVEMTAEALVARMGEELVGRHVMTEALGEYPGGRAKVVELTPDPEAPEIVYQVVHPTFGAIGVFESELGTLLKAYPDTLTSEQLGEVTGYSPSSGGFNNSLSRLRTLELITRGQPMRASEDFFQ